MPRVVAVVSSTRRGGLIELPAVSEKVEELAEAMHGKLSKKLQKGRTRR